MQNLTPNIPTISLIVPVKDKSSRIRASIDSILAQDYHGGFECIVVDGGSTDGTLDILADYRETITAISANDFGIYHALNKGILQSSGDLIGVLAAGDELLPGALTSVVQAIPQGITSDQEFIVAASVRFKPAGPTHHRSTTQPLSTSNSSLLHASLYLSRAAYALGGLYDVGFKVSADYYLIAGLLSRNVPVYYSDTIIVELEPFGFSAQKTLRKHKDRDHFITRLRYVGFLVAVKYYLRAVVLRTLSRLRKMLRGLIKGVAVD